MDYGTITLAFVALLLLYILYTFFFVGSQLVSNPVELNTPSGELKFTADKLKNPSSTRYYYEAYIYIESNATGTNNVLFHRGEKFLLALNGSSLRIYNSTTESDANTIGTINANYGDNGGVYTNTNAAVSTITNTFPFQKWVQVVVSVDGNAVDVYLEGQLVKTLSANFGTSSDLKTADLGAGNKVTVGKLKNFVYKPTVISPQEVYNSYMRQNSLAGMGGLFSKYGIDMSLLKNNESLFDIQLI